MSPGKNLLSLGRTLRTQVLSKRVANSSTTTIAELRNAQVGQDLLGMDTIFAVGVWAFREIEFALVRPMPPRKFVPFISIQVTSLLRGISMTTIRERLNDSLRSILPGRMMLTGVGLASLFFSFPTLVLAVTPLNTLYPRHPRLFLHDSELPAIKQAIATYPFLKQIYEGQFAIGEQLLNTPPDGYTIGGPEHTLLATSRDMEGRIFTLAGLYRLTGQKQFADRAIREMLAAASFPDWYPKHFLDTGEMTAALGVGYDWLYSVLTPEQRNTIEHAIATKGIDPWLDRINNGEAARHEHNNWNQVCNGGEGIGALAIADVDPQRADSIIDYARLAIGDIMGLFAPDGGFEEGPGYWNYATSYNVLFIDALDSALGSDFGMAEMPGFAETGDYHIQSTGPTDLFANFSDAGMGIYPSFQMFWFAHRYNKSDYAVHEREIVESGKLDLREARESSRFGIFLLIWAARDAGMTGMHPLPLIESFQRIDQAYMRSDWHDPNAWYVAFKGGDAHASHGHLDLGTFILDADDQRWASDLGPDNYGLPGYFGRQRWSYYRLRTEGHNTLTIDAKNEDLDAKAPLTAVGATGKTLYAIADLDQAYKGKLTSWSRGVALLNKQRVLVQDEIVPATPVDIVWNFHTFADVKIAADGRRATLSRGGKTLEASILAPAAARFSPVSAQAPPPNALNPGVTNLIISLPHQSGAETIAVLFAKSGDITHPVIKPLSTWK